MSTLPWIHSNHPLTMNNEEVGLASSVPWHVQEENVVIRYRHNGRIPLSLEVGIIKVLPLVS